MDHLVTVLIPNWNGGELLRECIDAVHGQSFQSYSILVVDNGSKDRSKEIVRQFYPSVGILELPVNQGFAGAVNRGVQASIDQSRFLLLLNNDVVLEKDFLEILVRFLEEHQDAMGVNPKLMNYFERDRIDTLGIYFRHGKAFDIGAGEKDGPRFPRYPFEIFGCNMGASLFRMDLFREVGYLDETFFAQYEDVDFAMRARWRGGKFYCIPEARAYHRRGWTAKKDKPFQHSLARRNDMYCAIKNFPTSMFLGKFLYSIVKDIPQIIQSPIRRKFRSKWRKHYEVYKNLDEMLAKRKRIMASRSISSKQWIHLFMNLPDLPRS